MIVRICVTIYFKRLIWTTAWSMSRTNKTFDTATCLRRSGTGGTPNPAAVPAESRRAWCDPVSGRALRLVNFYGLSGNLERRRTGQAGTLSVATATVGWNPLARTEIRSQLKRSVDFMLQCIKLSTRSDAVFKMYVLKLQAEWLQNAAFNSLCPSLVRRHVPPSRTSAEACLMG